MNQQLHLQALVLAEKVEEAKRNLKDSKKNDNIVCLNLSLVLGTEFVWCVTDSFMLFKESGASQVGLL